MAAGSLSMGWAEQTLSVAHYICSDPSPEQFTTASCCFCPDLSPTQFTPLLASRSSNLHVDLKLVLNSTFNPFWLLHRCKGSFIPSLLRIRSLVCFCVCFVSHRKQTQLIILILGEPIFISSCLLYLLQDSIGRYSSPTGRRTIYFLRRVQKDVKVGISTLMRTCLVALLKLHCQKGGCQKILLKTIWLNLHNGAPGDNPNMHSATLQNFHFWSSLKYIIPLSAWSTFTHRKGLHWGPSEHATMGKGHCLLSPGMTWACSTISVCIGRTSSADQSIWQTNGATLLKAIQLQHYRPCPRRFQCEGTCSSRERDKDIDVVSMYWSPSAL